MFVNKLSNQYASKGISSFTKEYQVCNTCDSPYQNRFGTKENLHTSLLKNHWSKALQKSYEKK